MYEFPVRSDAQEGKSLGVNKIGGEIVRHNRGVGFKKVVTIVGNSDVQLGES